MKMKMKLQSLSAMPEVSTTQLLNQKSRAPSDL